MFDAVQVIANLIVDAVEGVREFLDELFEDSDEVDPTVNNFVAKTVSLIVLGVAAVMLRSESVLALTLASHLAFVSRKMWPGVSLEA